MTNAVQALIQKHKIEFIAFRFTGLNGKEHYITIPHHKFDDNVLDHGKVFDGSSILGWSIINKSDLVLKPDLDCMFVDPFSKAPTLNIRCDIIDPTVNTTYARDPRGVAKRAEAYLRSTGIADTCNIGQEVEFFIFDDVRFDVSMRGSFYEVDSKSAAWNSGTPYDGGNMGHRPGIKGGYLPLPPIDSSRDLRNTMCQVLTQLGLNPEVHHHEVATANQNEITTRYDSLTIKADEMMVLKYALINIAHDHHKTVTFMPKPLMGDNGSGLHCHQSLALQGKNLLAGDHYAGLSELALYYTGGIIKHAKALNAFTNPSTNSYKRLVPGFEAPVTLVYSESNRSAAIRIPHVFSEKEKRIEVRFPDAMMNPYLGFSAMLMAGLDGIKNKIHPGDAVNENLYDLDDSQAARLPKLCSSLEEALSCLEDDYEFLLAGDVFSKDLIDAYIALKRKDVARVNMCPHPAEFEMYYSQ